MAELNIESTINAYIGKNPELKKLPKSQVVSIMLKQGIITKNDAQAWYANMEDSPNTQKQNSADIDGQTKEPVKRGSENVLFGGKKPANYDLSKPFFQRAENTEIENNTFGWEKFANPKPIYAKSEKTAVEFLTQMTSDASQNISTQDAKDGFISKWIVNLYKETVNSTNAKSNVKKAIEDTKQDISQLTLAASGALDSQDWGGNVNKVSFEDTFKKLRGVEFNETNIQNCQKKAKEMANVQTMKDMTDKLKQTLDSATVNSVQNAGYADANAAIMNTFKMLGMGSTGKINAALKDIEEKCKDNPEIKKYGGDFRISKNKAGKYIIYRTAKNGLPAEATMEELQVIAKEMKGRINTAFGSAIGAKIPKNASSEQLEKITQDTYQLHKSEYEQVFEKAYGKKDLKEMSEKYMQSQQEGTAYVEMAVNMASMAAMFVGSGVLVQGAKLGLKAAAGVDKVAKVTNFVSKAEKALKTAEAVNVGASKVMPYVMATQIAQPVKLVENLTAEESDWSTYFSSVAESGMWMALGMATGAAGDKARLFLGQKGLAKVAKDSGKSISELVDIYKSGGELPANLTKALKLIDSTAKAGGTSLEFTADVLMTYGIQKGLRGEEVTTMDYLMSANGAIMGTMMHNSFAKLAEKDKIKAIQHSLLETNPKISKAELESASKELLELHRVSETKKHELTTTETVPLVIKTEGKGLVLSEAGEKQVRKRAEEFAGIAAESESKIVKLMEQSGLGVDKKTMTHRPKCAQSLFDKIKNAMTDKDNPMSFEKAVKTIKDAVGTRTVLSDFDYKSHSDIVEIHKTNPKKAFEMACERQSQEMVDKVQKIILAQVENKSDISAIKLTNYMGKNGIPYFSDAQVAHIRDVAAKNGVDLSIRDKTTKIRPSGYTALQMNFVTKDGFTFEWQLRGSKINKFAECEHVPYDARENKDLTGGNEKLKALYAPIGKVIKSMSPEQYDEYNKYLTAHYEYLRKLELGFESEKPVLSKEFDQCINADNLEVLHDVAKQIKKNEISEEAALEKYNKSISQTQNRVAGLSGNNGIVNPGVNAANKLAQELGLRIDTERLVQNFPKAPRNYAGVNDELINVIKHLNPEVMNKRYEKLGDNIKDIITKHADEIRELDKKHSDDRQAFAQEFVNILSKELGCDEIPQIKLDDTGSADGYCNWPNYEIVLSENLKDIGGISQLVSHEFIHLQQTRDVISLYGEQGVRDIFAFNDATIAEVRAKYGAKFDEMQMMDKIELLYKETADESQDVLNNPNIQKVLEAAKQNPISEQSLRGYLAKIYAPELMNPKNVDEVGYRDELSEAEAYYLGNKRTGSAVESEVVSHNDVSLMDFRKKLKEQLLSSEIEVKSKSIEAEPIIDEKFKINEDGSIKRVAGMKMQAGQSKSVTKEKFALDVSIPDAKLVDEIIKEFNITESDLKELEALSIDKNDIVNIISVYKELLSQDMAKISHEDLINGVKDLADEFSNNPDGIKLINLTNTERIRKAFDSEDSESLGSTLMNIAKKPELLKNYHELKQYHDLIGTKLTEKDLSNYSYYDDEVFTKLTAENIKKFASLSKITNNEFSLWNVQHIKNPEILTDDFIKEFGAEYNKLSDLNIEYSFNHHDIDDAMNEIKLVNTICKEKGLSFADVEKRVHFDNINKMLQSDEVDNYVSYVKALTPEAKNADLCCLSHLIEANIPPTLGLAKLYNSMAAAPKDVNNLKYSFLDELIELDVTDFEGVSKMIDAFNEAKQFPSWNVFENSFKVVNGDYDGAEKFIRLLNENNATNELKFFSKYTENPDFDFKKATDAIESLKSKGLTGVFTDDAGRNQFSKFLVNPDCLSDYPRAISHIEKIFDMVYNGEIESLETLKTEIPGNREFNLFVNKVLSDNKGSIDRAVFINATLMKLTN